MSKRKFILLCSALLVCLIAGLSIVATRREFPKHIDGGLPATEGLSHLKMARETQDDHERYKLLDAVLSTSNSSIEGLSGQDWCDFYNGIHSLASSEQSRSGSVESEHVKRPEDATSEFGQRIFNTLARMALESANPKRAVDYRALNYSERLFRKAIAIGTPTDRTYSSDYRKISQCLSMGGDKIGAKKAMNSYREALIKKEHAYHWTIQANALSEHARFLEEENKLPEAEQS